MLYRRMLISVGIFVVLTAVLLVLSFGYIIQKKGIFEKKYHFNLVASSGSDLIEGMPVVYSGFKIGVVTRLELTETGRVEVVIEIPNHERRWLKENSKFYLNKPLIGSPTIMVESKQLEASLLDDNAERQLITKDGINELISKVQPVLDDLQGIVNNVNDLTGQKSDLAKILTNVEKVTYKLSQSDVVTGLDAAIAELEAGIADIRQELVNKKHGILPGISEGVLGKENSTLSRVNAMLDDISAKLKKLDQSVDAINESSSEVSGLTKDAKFSMKKADDVLDGVSGFIGSKAKGKVVLP